MSVCIHRGTREIGGTYVEVEANGRRIIFVILWTLFLLLLASCVGPQHRLTAPYSPQSLQTVNAWQDAVDSIVAANFPNERGKYKAVVWEDDFDNAWVVKGREINITKRFLNKLNDAFRKCVAAHELAHLKMGHYYAKSGIIILDALRAETPDKGALKVDHYGHTLNLERPKGFGVNQEEEADRLALVYLERVGIDKSRYLDLLAWLRGKRYEAGSSLSKRIKFIERIINE